MKRTINQVFTNRAAMYNAVGIMVIEGYGMTECCAPLPP